ncbi:hypothetical protein V474_07860 [Novosphingobium barchaimii LL02]|uniref:Uncharacterized protein n=1 Tax=Novosphingobium barchaimii LL02 TaxID=1114963 RepID=A0A0J7Y741_9SPHN|nr:hypothetical protein [Novosphingobium barchaimii]KMS59148.1 hypothetical protein V474_07860 [Novosphingobium barchaimii LL02]
MILSRKEQILDRQKRMFRIAQDPTRIGLTLKMIAADADLNLQSVRNYAAGETEMPMSALDALIGVLPDDLLSLLLPAGHAIVTVPDGICHDEIEKAARDFLAAKGEAHHPSSPGGRELSACEIASLNRKAAKLRAVA